MAVDAPTGAEVQGGARPSATEFARVSFTGRMLAISRRDAIEQVRRRGGVVTTGVSRRTTLLVVGAGGWPIRADGSVSRTLRRAEAMNAAGARIRIAPERLFLELVGLEERAPRLRKTYTFDQVLDLLGLDATTLRRWEALGLIRSEEGRYDFPDIVALRTIAELIGRGVAPATIARSVRGLAAVLPDVQRPLAQLRLVESSGELLAEIGDALIAPDGQLVIDFGGAAAAADRAPARGAAPIVLGVAGGWHDAGSAGADEWFERGAALEEEDRLDEAAGAYERAIELRPRFAAAHFNLGNVLRALDRAEAAAERFRAAAAHDRDMAAAWYNLADVQEELGRPLDAIESLRRAVEIAPDYADAHYNLAMCLASVGRAAEARAHFERYLRLDPRSVWADVAREKLAALAPR
jgi:tetratricopeptide (TPR) repeat protein